jgi:uncharacterized protein YaaN involved in tellurite resistance
MNEVSLRGDEYIAERAGKPLLAIIPIEKYQSMQEKADSFFESLSEMRENIRDEDSKVMDGLINEAVRAYKKPKSKAKKL